MLGTTHFLSGQSVVFSILLSAEKQPVFIFFETRNVVARKEEIDKDCRDES